MFSDHKSRNRIFALLVLIVSLILYMITISPTASFWDSGEFIAVAHGLQVNHPPGAPFYSLLGRLFSMFMPTLWVAVSINFISSLCSALTIMLLYLIIVRLVREWKGHPDQYEKIDLIGMYGGAIIGAFAFAVTDTFWFNAVESEVYAISIFFTAIVIWLALKWAEQHDQPYSERWLVLIAYMFGIALGVHLLNLLAMFFVALIIYFKKRRFELLSFAAMGAITVVSFLIVYPFTVQQLPDIADDIEHATYGLLGPVSYIILIVLILGAGIYYTHKKKYRLANIILMSYAMIMIGYSSYALIFIRSLANPPIDENNPETVESFVSYLKREQYGQTPLLKGNTFNNETGQIDRDKESWFPRRWSNSGRHLQKYAQYDSDWDFFIKYQIGHMYLRYFNWNFIGKDSDLQDAPWQAGFSKSRHADNPAHNSYYYLPFLLGLFGLIFHFQNDWKRALSVLALFVMTGLAIIVFLNQTPYQPRERDYAYVGSFFAFSIWIGLGATGIIELIKEYLNKNTTAAYGALGLLFLGVPFLMGYQNFDDHDRSGRYVAPDYAYNLLNSTAPNAILFTNGDNDTFPLWYLQEVEGVRTDVRVVCLSLLNTNWYIKQLKNQWSHESAPIKISYTDEQIDHLDDKFSFSKQSDFYKPHTISIPVNKGELKKAFSDSSFYRKEIGVNSDTTLNVFAKGTDYGIPVDSLDNTVSWYYEGNELGQDRQGNKLYYTRIQDDMILDILKQNQWVRPVYFANTVSRESQLNLQKYFRLEGQAFRVVPQKHEEATYGYIDPRFHTQRLRKFRFRNTDAPGVYFDENIRRMLNQYRFGVTQLADRFMDLNEPDSALTWLEWGQEKIPFKVVNDDMTTLVSYAFHYAQLDAMDRALDLAEMARTEMMGDLKYRMKRYDDMQSEVAQLDQQAKEARANADMAQQRKLRSQAQEMMARQQSIVRNISYASSRLIIVQRIYYMAGKDQQADSLAQQVNDMTMDRIGFPKNKEENKKQVDRIYFN